MNTTNITKDELNRYLYDFCMSYYEEDDSVVDKLFDAFTIELIDGEQVASFNIDEYKGKKDKLYDYFKPHQGNINTHLDELFLDYLNSNYVQNIENLIKTNRYIEAKDIMSKEIQDVIEGNEYSTIEVQYNAYAGMSDDDEPNTELTCNPDMLESAIDNDDFEEEDEATIQKLKDVVELCKKHDISYIVMREYNVDDNN